MGRTRKPPRQPNWGMEPSVKLSVEDYSIYMSNEGLVGHSGAQEILKKMSPSIAIMHIGSNGLGDEGAIALFAGLDLLRVGLDVCEEQYATLEVINLESNGLSDEGLEVIMRFVSSVNTSKLCLDDNMFKLERHLDTIINCFNSSHLRDLSLNGNPHLTPTSLNHLFGNIYPSNLLKLSLARCQLDDTCLAAIAGFLGDPRSRTLESLNLEHNEFGIEGIGRLAKVIQTRNFSLQHLIIRSREPTPSDRSVAPTESGGESEEEGEEDEEDEEEEGPRWMARQPAEIALLSASLRRNREHSHNPRVEKAALYCLAAARILLNAFAMHTSPLSSRPESIPPAQEGMRRSVTDNPSTSKLVELPLVILTSIIRHPSGDPRALSQNQFARILSQAESKEPLKAILRVRDGASYCFEEEWLRWAGLDRWESDVES